MRVLYLEKRTKLEPYGRKGIFVGYNETSKAYRIYLPEQGQVELNRDVTSKEGIAFKRSQSSDELEIQDSPKNMEEESISKP